MNMNRGFTLIETLIAIAVLTIAIAGPYTLVQGVLQTSYTARDQLIASSLAEEGIEYVRYVRDSNFVYATHHATTVPWLQGFDGSNGGADCYNNYCIVDPSTPLVTACGASANSCNSFLLRLSSANLYNQVTGSATKYVRTVHLTQISSTETQVSVTVSWSSHGAHSVTLTENLQNWL